MIDCYAIQYFIACCVLPQFSPDPVVKIFDMRMPDCPTTLPVSTIIPSFVSLLPNAPQAIRRMLLAANTEDMEVTAAEIESLSYMGVMAASSEGYAQVIPLNSDQEDSPVFAFYCASFYCVELFCS